MAREASLPDVSEALVSLAHPSVVDHTLRREASPAPPAGDTSRPGWKGVVRLEHAYAQGALLGVGGVGTVAAARHRVLDRDVAVKSVRPERRSPGSRRALLREAAAPAAVAHPHIISVHDVVKDEQGEPHVVMQRVEGGTWLDYLVEPDRITTDFGARDRLAWHVGILEQVCQAIHHAHSKGVLHRDLKPDNVMIGLHGEVYVVDWGLAVRFTDDGPRRLPHAHHERNIVGTPRFMAPEMAAADGPALSPRTDVYLLGGLLYAVLTGQGPHPGNDVETTLALIPHFQPSFPAGTPTRLASLVRQCMAADPTDRLDSADALRRGLQAWTEARAAEDLVAEAERQLAELVVAIADPRVGRMRVYRHFGAARFGFQRALAAWPDLAAARVGLDRALATVAGYELDQDDPRAASLLMSELSRPNAGLLARLGEVEETLAARHRAAELRAADADPSTRQRTRIFVFSVLMLLWTLVPLAAWGWDIAVTMPRMVAAHVVSLAATTALLVWARDSLSRSALNRGVATLLVVIHISLVMGDVGGAALGLDAAQVFTFHHLLFAVLAAVSVPLLGAPSLVVAGVYSAVFLLGSMQPSLVLPASGLTNLVVAATAFLVWKPDDLRSLFFRSAAERSRAARTPS